MSEHTPTPWFVSGIRFKMNGGEWQSVNRYDATTRQDENIACVGYDPRTGAGLTDAHFIVKAVNAHEMLVKTLEGIAEYCSGDDTTLGALHRLTSIRNTALTILSRVSRSGEREP